MKKLIGCVLIISTLLCSMTGCRGDEDKSRKDRRDRDREESSNDDVPLIFRLATVDKDTYTAAMEDLYGVVLTESDFTEDRGVQSSMYHCVVNENNVTYIYLEFPNHAATDDYWDTFTTYFDRSYIVESEGEFGYIVQASSNYMAMYRNGNVIISAGTACVDTPMTSAYNSFGGFEDIDEYLHYLNYPSPLEISDGIADMEGVHFGDHVFS